MGILFFVANLWLYNAGPGSYYMRQNLWVNEEVALILIVLGIWVSDFLGESKK